jgi:hypothetical protein
MRSELALLGLFTTEEIEAIEEKPTGGTPRPAEGDQIGVLVRIALRPARKPRRRASAG